MTQVARFAGRLAVVTGGASGIGAAVVRELAREGAEVLIADLDLERAAQLVASLDAAGDSTAGQGAAGSGVPGASSPSSVATRPFCVQARALDVRDRAAVEALFAALPRAPALLVTCAGGAARSAALDTDEASFAASLQLNTMGFWRCAQVAARAALGAGTPLSIVHVASSLHRGPAPGLAHFAAAKAASVTLVRCLAQEWAAQGIRVNAVVPGPVETPMTTPVWDALPGLRASLRAGIPLGRLGEPGDVARAVAWLASDEAAWVTGTLLTVDGGLDVAP